MNNKYVWMIVGVAVGYYMQKNIGKISGWGA
jgi:hypothetical protein